MEDIFKIEQENNEHNGRFVIKSNNAITGEMSYSWAGTDKFIIDHTEVGTAFGGKGFGRKLLMEAVAFARKQNVKIIPLCPYAKSVFDKDESIRDVLFH
ncbi:MAG TPA: GNAT family N-acetyltransferase [Edaphocola sp.]|nr:GNAT family N-acetyltransferase [Edaphocola sp.]